MKGLILAMIRLYQIAISPFLAQRCIHYPTCSAYAAEAVELHGWLRGTGLAMRRLLRCHPFAEGGYDPVPDINPEHQNANKIMTADVMKEQQ
ncbi:MAG: membrane protein insertion efficiency factor YidD [Zetaproteobacteria bacterium CG2_30_59_37]|nr:MAG: membrane protein insertion efficiency factor YidD [Zetaproteobacteria bacterium CG2_30_59_37]